MNFILRVGARLAVLMFAAVLVQLTACAQNFAMNLEPSTVTLVPGLSSSFIVYLTPLDGFATNVTLSTTSLPAGVTAVFSPNPVTPPGSSILTLNATTNATLGSFTLNVSGSGGGITNTTSSQVTVDFGLIPICTGAFTGKVTDAQTGLPVPGAYVYISQYATTTDSNGLYTLANLPLNNNGPAQYDLQAVSPAYWQSEVEYAYAVCDATNTVNLKMVRQQYGSVSGIITIQGGGPAAGFRIQVQNESVLTDSNGFYQATGLTLSYTNAPGAAEVSYNGSAAYWQVATQTVIQANSNSVVNLTVLPVCFGNISGTVLYGDTLQPATNATVQVGYGTTNTDGNGNYTLVNVPLNYDNAPLQAAVVAAVPAGYYRAQTNVTLNACGVTAATPTILLPPIPRSNYGAVSGHVYDVQTGLPIAGAYVNNYTATDTNGAYSITNVYIGLGGVTNGLEGFSAYATGYFESGTNIELYADQTSPLDFYLLRVGYGGVAGTVRDSQTALPLTNVTVQLFGAGIAVRTDANGHYFSGPLPLNSGNSPGYVTIEPTLTGYYPVEISTSYTNSLTNVVNFSLLKVCTGATIVGNVVNAQTQQPITNATLVAGYSYAYTDTNGNFILTNITVGNLNSPLQVTVQASAPGFIAQSHPVTIFCNATITTEFGVPQTAFGIIEGVVTNSMTGQPLVGAFIGSQFGEATTTDTNGYYQLTQAPLGANNSSRTWTVTAIPTNFIAQTLSVTVSSNAVSTLNFGFGAPPTHLLVSGISSPNPVTVGSNLVYTLTLANNGADAANVQLNDQLAPTLSFVSASITNPPGGSFSTPVFSNNVITTTSPLLSSNQTLVLVVTAVPTVPGSVTNFITVTSSTPDTDPTGANRSAQVVNTVNAPVFQADLGLALTALPNPILVSNQLAYSFLVTNAGPVDAAGVVLDDLLPPDTVFVSTTNSQGTFSHNGGALEWDLGTITNGGIATISLIVTPLVTGLVTNMANVAIGPGGGTVTDPNLFNNTATVVTTVTAPLALHADLGLALTALPNPIEVGNQLTYSFFVTNAGPTEAAGVALNDQLPANTVFVSTTNSQGSFSQNGGALEWELGTIRNGGTATISLIVTPLAAGLLANSATVAIGPGGGTVTDTNQLNNTAGAVVTVLAPSQTNGIIVESIGVIILNRQTGLYEQRVVIQNLEATAIAAVRLYVNNLPVGVALYDRIGSTNGVPYVEYDQPVPSGGAVSFALEYYSRSRASFGSTNFTAIAVAAATPPQFTGTLVPLDQPPTMPNGQFLIEFASTPGATYVIQYSSDLKTWISALPPVAAAANRVQWIDAGPPKTASTPSSLGSRYYRVLQTTGVNPPK